MCNTGMAKKIKLTVYRSAKPCALSSRGISRVVSYGDRNGGLIILFLIKSALLDSLVCPGVGGLLQNSFSSDHGGNYMQNSYFFHQCTHFPFSSLSSSSLESSSSSLESSSSVSYFAANATLAASWCLFEKGSCM